MSDTLFGIPIRTSRHVPPRLIPDPSGAKEMRAYDDWRERLDRNLKRPSTGKWEPLDRLVPVMVWGSDVYLIGGEIIAAPNTVAIIRNVAHR